MTRTDAPASPDERSTLLAMLTYVRQTAVDKVRGLSTELARSAPLTTSPLTAPAAILNHLRRNDNYWLRVVVLGEDNTSPLPDDTADAEMEEGLAMTVDEVVAAYEAQMSDSRSVEETLDLETLTAEPLHDFHPNVRWVLLHLIEETARHNGHLDLLREMADGSVGS